MFGKTSTAGSSRRTLRLRNGRVGLAQRLQTTATNSDHPRARRRPRRHQPTRAAGRPAVSMAELLAAGVPMFIRTAAKRWRVSGLARVPTGAQARDTVTLRLLETSSVLAKRCLVNSHSTHL